MKKIACVGYHGTGAGVVDDLFREFDNVCQGRYECEARLLQDPDGISDLEFNLVENPHRTNSGFAIKRFVQYVNRVNHTYKYIFGSDWKKISMTYVDSLVKEKFQGYSECDTFCQPLIPYSIFRMRRAFNKMLPKMWKKPNYYNYFPKITSYHAFLTEQDFLQKTRRYIERLCHEMNFENKEYVLLDQLISANNPERYLRYVDDVKVIVVDRDPRDLYINHTKCADHKLPKDPRQFCVVYKDIRKMVCPVPEDKCLYMKFEDMIYHYDASVDEILQFVGISKKNHISPRKYFDPNKSIKGAQMWKRFPQYQDAVRIIERELPDYLYPYPAE